MIDYVDVPSGGSVELVDVVSGAVTDLHVPLDLRPGDVAWSPDGRTLLFSDGPGSTMGSNDHLVAPGFIHRIGVDGSGLVVLRGWAGPEYLPDGSRILYQDNELYSMLPDGTDARKVSSMDVTTDVAGYVYIVHWLPPS
jgi:dipeptidyl aminopeptidase/acylaminoacyl peptidase